jgi:hypothetical protein
MRRRCEIGLVLLVAMAAGIGTAAAQVTDPLRGSVEENILLRSRAATAEDANSESRPAGIPAPEYRPFSAGASAAATADTTTPEDPFASSEPVADAIQRPEPDEVLASEIPVPPGRRLATGAIGPVQGGRAEPDPDPFAATGIRLGSFTLRPTVEIGLTGSRDTSASQSGATVTETTTNSVLADSTLRLNLASDWERHSLEIDASGRLQRTLNGSDELEPEITVGIDGTFEITDTTTLSASGGYSYALEDPQSAAFFAATDPSLVPAVFGNNQPATQSLDGSLDLRQEFGKVYGQVGVSADRTIYGAAELSDGSTITQSDLDNTVYDATLRAGFEASPVFSPFVEGSYGMRRMDQAPDSGGADRNAKRYSLRGGTAFDFGEKLNGEVSLGYVHEDIADSTLADISGLAVGAIVNWSPRRETDVSLNLATSTESSGSTGESGAVLYSADLAVTHRIRADLTAELSGGVDFRDAQGGADETTVNAAAGFTYWFNRFAGLTTRIGHEQTFSSDALNRSKTTTAFIGLRLQR